MEAELVVKQAGSEPKRIDLEGEVYIGSSPDCQIQVEHRTPNKRFAKILCSSSKIMFVELADGASFQINGKRARKAEVLKLNDSIKLDNYEIVIEPKGKKVESSPEQMGEESEAAPSLLDAIQQRRVHETKPKGVEGLDAITDEHKAKEIELRADIHKKLIEEMNLRKFDISQLGDKELRQKTEEVLKRLLAGIKLPAFIDKKRFIKDLLDEALALGPLEDFLADPTITEVMVNRKDQIYVERGGRLELTDKVFSSDEAIKAVIQRIVAPLGRRIDESSPMVDARLKDGSRVNAVIPPIAIKGPSITIRKFFQKKLTADDLIRFETLTPNMVEFIKLCVENRKNIIISGGTGSGKTTTLNVVSSFIPSRERIVTIEDSAELRLPQEHWVSLEARPPNIEGKGAIPIRQLVINALRMRPDRIVVGECRGGETLDMLQAMNTGHDGSLTTLHSNSPRDTLARLETMVMFSGVELPSKAIREQISSAIDVIVHQTRFPCGSRKITHITEVQGMEGDTIILSDIFLFKQEGYGPDGKVRGRFVATGHIPRFVHDLRERGIPVDISIFDEGVQGS